MKNNYPKVSIITVNFNGKEHLKKLFDSIFCLNYPKNQFDVIFVDNISTDNSIEFVKKNYPKVKVIKNDVNNYCKAINLGIEASKAEYAALINNDVQLDKNWLIELIKVIIKDKRIAEVGSKILNMAGKIQNAAHYELPNFYWGERGAGQERKRYSNLEEVSSLCGAAVLYRKDVLFEVGLFDEDFVIYGEDVDMALRLRQKDYKLVFVPTSIVYHKFHGTASEDFARHYIERNRLLFLTKHYPHKLNSSLLGSGYFTARKSLESCGKIYSIFPDIIMKLIKTHPLAIVNEVASELFGEISKIVNYENDLLAKEINKITEDRNKTYEIKDRVFTELQQEIQRYLNILQNKESILQTKEKELVAYKDELNNLSTQLSSRMDEVLIKDGQLIESKTEINALKDELSRLAEELATKLVTIEEDEAYITERETELKVYKEELSLLSNQLKSRMDEVLIKDGQLIERDSLISNLNEELKSYKEELSLLSNQLKSRMDEILIKDGQLIERDSLISNLNSQITQFKDELNNLSNQLHQRMDEILLKDGEIIHLKEELNGIYNSEGFRFVLRPLWTVIWHTRIFLKAVGRKLANIFWLTATFILAPIFLFLSLSLLLEYISWVALRPLLKRIAPKRKVESIDDKKISIVISNWNGISYLRECLPAIFSAEGFTDGQNEVLVVDDGSTDGSVDFVRTHFPQVRLIQNRRNRGFAFTCNRGIRAAKNEVIVLINNDIILTKDFLKPLISHLQKEDVFVVTPKLYAWDRETFVWGMHMGHFEEGYIKLWNEAETGNGDRINQISPSIFAIGGAMVFRKRDFVWLGGFDHIYRPNCWEDIDISYRAWKRGLKVIYEPHSLMYHKGKATLTYERHKEIKNELLFTWKNITDPQILKNHLNLLPWNLYRNKTPFLKGFFWALNYLPETLLHRLWERRFMVEFEDKKIFNKIMLYYRNFVKNDFKHRQNEKPNVLIISRFIPYPLNTGGKIRIHTLAKLLSDKYNFLLLSLIDHEDELKNIPKLKEVFSEIYPVLAKSPLNLDFSSKLFYPDLYKFAYSYSQELVNKLKEIQKTKLLDIIHIESNELLYMVDYVKQIPIVYTEHDISILTPGRSYYQKNGYLVLSFLDYLKRFHFHISKFKRLDEVITLSREDEKVLRTLFPKSDITLVPTCVDLEHFSFEFKPKKSKKLIFIGHYRHYPNEDAIVYFTKKIFPLIRKRIPEIELLIVGSNPTPKVESLAQERNVVLVGEVSDVKPYLEEAAVFVNSIRVSAGIKGKLLEAMAVGVPVVSTTTGSYGIEALPGREILIADTPRKFAKQVISLLRDDVLREKIAKEARCLVEKKYDWREIINRLDAVYKSTLFGFEAEESKDSRYTAIEQILDRTKDIVEQKIAQSNGLMKPEEGPEELHIELTYNCNSKCVMCDLWDYQKRSPKSTENELSLDEIRRFVEESRHLQKTKTVVLSGGEPFFRKDIVDLCGFFSKYLPNSSINILTNAMNTDDVVAKTKAILDKFHPKSLSLGSSLDGLGREHDRIRGTDGAFLTFHRTIERCKKELPGVKLSVTFTLTPYNIDQLIPAKEFADNEGIEFFAQFVVPKEAREEFIWTPQNLELAQKEIMRIIQGIISKMDQRAIFDSIDKIKDKNLISQLYYWSHLVKYQTNPQRFFKKCVSGSKFAMFNPYGDLFFCPTHKGSFIGNIREQRFDNLWMSDRAQHTRSFINDSNCHCWLVCIVFPVLEKALSNR